MMARLETKGKSRDPYARLLSCHLADAARHAVEAEVRLYELLFAAEDPLDLAEGQDFTSNLHPNSLEVVTAFVEPSLGAASVGDVFQFERLGYFCVDPDSSAERRVFDRTVTLRDSWAKAAKKKR